MAHSLLSTASPYYPRKNLQTFHSTNIGDCAEKLHPASLETNISTIDHVWLRKVNEIN